MLPSPPPEEPQDPAGKPLWLVAVAFVFMGIGFILLWPFIIVGTLLKEIVLAVFIRWDSRQVARERAVGLLQPDRALSHEEKLKHLPRALLAFREGEDLRYAGHVLKKARLYRAATLAVLTRTGKQSGSIGGFDSEWTEVIARVSIYGYIDHTQKLYLHKPGSRKSLTRVELLHGEPIFVVAAEERTGRHLVFIKAAAYAVRSAERAVPG